MGDGATGRKRNRKCKRTPPPPLTPARLPPGGRTQETYRVDFESMTQTNTAGAGCIGCLRGVGDAGGRVTPNAG